MEHYFISIPHNLVVVARIEPSNQPINFDNLLVLYEERPWQAKLIQIWVDDNVEIIRNTQNQISRGFLARFSTFYIFYITVHHIAAQLGIRCNLISAKVGY